MTAKRIRDPKGGLTAFGRKVFRRRDGAILRPGVKGAADTPTKARRKGSFLRRFFANPRGPMKKPSGEPTRLALSAAAWGEPDLAHRLGHLADLLDGRLVDPLWRAFAARALQVAA